MRSAKRINSDEFMPSLLPRKVWIKIVSCASFLIVLSILFSQFGCGGDTLKPSPPGQAGTPNTPAANISVSPGGATVGSSDLTLTISALNNFTFYNHFRYCRVLWSQGGLDTDLLTTFISSSQLTAIVPASLLTAAVTAKVRVEIWDGMEGILVATSGSVPFQVALTPPPPTPTPSISSISPSTVAAGSPDVTITIDGTNFGHFGTFKWSTAFWTTNGNLHDTGTWLQTTIVSNSQLTAVIPAALLRNPTSVHIVVMNGDVMGMSDGYFGYPRSNSVTFRVTP